MVCQWEMEAIVSAIKSLLLLRGNQYIIIHIE